LALWLSGNALVSIIEVTLHSALLVLGWVTDLQAGKPFRYVTATEVDSAFYPLWDGKMSISLRAE